MAQQQHHHHHHHHHHRSLYPHSRKAQEEEAEPEPEPEPEHRKPRSSLLRLLFLFLFLLLSFLLLSTPRLPFLFLSDLPSREAITPLPSPNLCSPSSPLCCDRSAFRTDICFLNGDIRTRSSSSSFFIFSNSSSSSSSEEQRIRPYTRKWEAPIMSTINELRLNLFPANLTSATTPKCDVHHSIPAVVFSTGGYTGNVYHEFNDGLIPLYLTSRRFNRRVLFLILEYHDWWISKYGDVISVLSDFPAIDFSADSRTHCFPQAIVGLRIDDELAVDGTRAAGNETMADFRRILDEAYRPRILSILREQRKSEQRPRPKLVVICRNGSRAIENEAELEAVAEEVGFRVELLRPERTTEMAKIYMALNSSDAMIGVHGAAMTHLLFMRPGAVFIQIVPLGLDWAAETYYGQPAVKAKLKYESYRIMARESSLSREYGRDDPVLKDPESVNAKGWEETKRVYLDGQRVRLDLVRFRKRLVKAHRYLVFNGKADDR